MLPSGCATPAPRLFFTRTIPIGSCAQVYERQWDLGSCRLSLLGPPQNRTHLSTRLSRPKPQYYLPRVPQACNLIIRDPAVNPTPQFHSWGLATSFVCEVRQWVSLKVGGFGAILEFEPEALKPPSACSMGVPVECFQSWRHPQTTLMSARAARVSEPLVVNRPYK